MTKNRWPAFGQKKREREKESGVEQAVQQLVRGVDDAPADQRSRVVDVDAVKHFPYRPVGQ